MILFYFVVQAVKSKKMDGFSCSVKVSTFNFYCGVYAHMKIMRIPKIQQTIILSASECQNIYRRRQFKTPDKVSHPISVPGETIIPSFDVGTITDEGDISCKGQSLKEPNGKIVDRALQLSQYTITIREENYELRGSQIETTSAHLQFPKSCKVNAGYCATTSTSFMWNLPKTRCKLEKVRDVEFQEESGYLVDHSTKILLKITGSQPAPEKCPITEIYRTEYPDLFLTIDKRSRFHDLGTELEIDTYARALNDYTLFEAESKIAKLGDASQQAICENSYHETEKIHHISKNHFATRKGEVIYLFQCKKEVAPIGIKKACFTMIPLKKGGFVNPDNRVLTSKAPQEKCSQYHPLIIEAEEGWIALSPLPKQVSTPEKMPIAHYLKNHEDLSKGGIYTQAELDSWREHLDQMGLAKALTNQITYGVCVNEGECPSISGQETLNYDLSNLQAKVLNNLSFFAKVKQWVIEYAAYISCFVLILELAKFALTLSTISMALTKNGLNGVKVILLTLCCSSYVKYIKLRDSKKRRHVNEHEMENRPSGTNDDP